MYRYEGYRVIEGVGYVPILVESTLGSGLSPGDFVRN